MGYMFVKRNVRITTLGSANRKKCSPDYPVAAWRVRFGSIATDRIIKLVHRLALESAS
jgi:hypothetical protein